MKALAKAIYRNVPLKRQMFEIGRGRLPERIYRHLHFKGPFTVDIGAGRSFRMMSGGDILENDLFWTPFGRGLEGVSARAWAALADRADGAILDVGANTGLYSLIALACQPEADVYAFEPVRRVADRLRENFAINGFSAAVIEKASSDVNARVPIYDNAEGMEYDASLEKDHGDHEVSYEVEAIRLDDFLSTPVGLMKIDVEQHEPAVIRGAMAMIRAHRPAILIETIFDKPTAELNRQLAGLGYLIFNIDERRGMVRSNELRMLSPGSWNNLLVTPADYEASGLKRLLA
jgi:FkbM family methyltransferase